MKRILISLLLVMLTFVITFSTTAFAVEEKYPPLETGHYGYVDTDKYPVVYPDKIRQELPLDENIENTIKEDFILNVRDDATIEELYVEYYGTLSDGGMLVLVDGPFAYFGVTEEIVIKNYLYSVATKGKDIEIYKNGEFTSIIDSYQNGDLSEELLDETAELLCFGKFVDPNEPVETPTEAPTTDPEKTTEPSATEPKIAVATPDETTNNNSNGSIPTGDSNTVIIFVVLVLAVSGTVILSAKNKKKI